MTTIWGYNVVVDGLAVIYDEYVLNGAEAASAADAAFEEVTDAIHEAIRDKDEFITFVPDIRFELQPTDSLSLPRKVSFRIDQIRVVQLNFTGPSEYEFPE